ncbi:serine hydrolase [Massilia sp. Root418]|uniref:serine hydrolase domain-containing protein n=1 Tax=Massilia sp. Root418 TaxID=1736532 RepID=UPI001911167B|nr:serine hydrolase domain-containing protein [Massilia sp. Root418]
MSTQFKAVHGAMQAWVDGGILAGASCALLSGGAVVDSHCAGWADKEAGTALREDHLFRVFSNTKLVTSIAALQLVEQGRLGLDEPVESYLPALGGRRVLRAGATRLDDSEPARRSITARHLLCHSAGLSYGFLDPGSLIYQAYTARRVMHADSSLEGLIAALAPLPLTFHPGEQWEYSIASDVLARLVEVASGQRFDRYLAQAIFAPLGMADTCFVIPPDKHGLLTAYYAGASRNDPTVPGLRRLAGSPYPGAYLAPVARYSGGGGLVSSLPDMAALLRSLMPGAPCALLRPDTVAAMMRNQLPPGVRIGFPTVGAVPGKGFGLGGAVILQPGADDPPASAGEFEWGGIAGTQWWINPRHNIAGVLMAQRQMGFWHPYTFEFKRLAYQALLA